MDKKEQSAQRGVIALTVPLLLLILAAVIFILIGSGIIKNPLKTLSLSGVKKEPTVSLQKQYQNPFEGKFVNPFAGYKNPFDALK